MQATNSRYSTIVLKLLLFALTSKKMELKLETTHHEMNLNTQFTCKGYSIVHNKPIVVNAKEMHSKALN